MQDNSCSQNGLQTYLLICRLIGALLALADKAKCIYHSYIALEYFVVLPGYLSCTIPHLKVTALMDPHMSSNWPHSKYTTIQFESELHAGM